MKTFKVLKMRAHSLLMEAPNGQRAYAGKRVANELLSNSEVDWTIQEADITDHDTDSPNFGKKELWFATFSRW